LLHVGERLEPLVVVVAQPPRLVVDDEREPGQPVDDRKQLIDLLLVLDHGDRHLHVIEDVGHLLRDRVGVDRHRHCAERLRGAHGPVEARSVGADDRHLVVALEAELRETDRKRAHLVEHLRPGPYLPDAEVLVSIGRAPRIEAGVAHQELGERIRASGIGRHGHPPFTAPNPAGHKAPSCRSPADRCGRIRKWACAEVKSALGVARPALGSVRRAPRASGQVARLRPGAYSAALSSGVTPARSCSSSAASSALAALRWRSLTWPKPRIFSGIAASPTATWWLSPLSRASTSSSIAS